MDNGANSYRRFCESGDEEGLAEIIRDYKDGLILYLNSIVGDIYIAEDLAIDTFARIGVKKPKDNGKGSFKTWLYTIGRNIALDYLRKRARTAEVNLDDIPELTDDESDLSASYIKEERKQLLHRCMRRLKEEYRQVLWLIYFDGLSNKEASRVMGKTVHGIETLVSRARKSLKQQLESEGFIYEE